MRTWWHRLVEKVALRLRYVGRALRIVWVAARGWVVAWMALLLVHGVLPGAIVYLTRDVVDGVAMLVQGTLPPGDLSPVLVPVLLMAVAIVLSEVLSGLTGWISLHQAERVQDYVQGLIHDKAAAVDLGFFETPAYYDLLERARRESARRPLAMIQTVGQLVRSVVTLVTVAGILLLYGWVLPLLLVLSTLPALVIVVRHNRREYEWNVEHTAHKRRALYYDLVLTVDKTAPEVRLFEMGHRFRERYQEARRVLREGQIRLYRQRSVAQLGASMTGLAVVGGAMLWMVHRATRGLASLGDLALFYQAFNQGQGVMRTLFNSAGQLYTHTLFVDHLFHLMDLEPRVHSPAAPRPTPRRLQQGITFDRVSFRYPLTERYALRDFSLTLPAGRITAVVGANGAGKSTLIKLLCRFYDPEAGTVRIDGTDIRDLDLDALRRLITVMFQDPYHFQAPIDENIAMTDLGLDEQQARVEAAARAAGADGVAGKLPRGYQTLLGKAFEGGTELSGGEWQRVLLARAFFREAPIVILDEPTSKMDSWSENAWYDRFARLVEGRTALLITHRFTTAMRADKICVLDHGRLVEEGSHDELLALGGRYAESWRVQMRQHTTTDPSLTPNGTHAGAYLRG